MRHRLLCLLLAAVVLAIPAAAQHVRIYSPGLEFGTTEDEAPGLPHVLEVGKTRWTLREVPKILLPGCDGCFSAVDVRYHTIQVLTGVPYREQRISVLHEVSHCILLEQGISLERQHAMSKISLHEAIYVLSEQWELVLEKNPTLAHFLDYVPAAPAEEER